MLPRSNAYLLLQGFVDAHVHLMMGAQTLESLDLNSVRSREQLAQALAEAAGLPPRPSDFAESIRAAL